MERRVDVRTGQLSQLHQPGRRQYVEAGQVASHGLGHVDNLKAHTLIEQRHHFARLEQLWDGRAGGCFLFEDAAESKSELLRC